MRAVLEGFLDSPWGSVVASEGRLVTMAREKEVCSYSLGSVSQLTLLFFFKVDSELRQRFLLSLYLTDSKSR